MNQGYLLDRSGASIGLKTSDLVGFHGVTRVVQRVGAAQAAVVATSGVAITPTIGAAVVTTGAALVSYGYTQAQADAIVARLNQILVDSAAQTVLINTLRVDLIAALALVNELRAAIVEKGLIKGAA